MLLEPMLARLAAARDLASVLRVGLQDVIALHGTETGHLQLVDREGHLVVVEAHGVSREFLRMLERIHVDSHSICARAARLRKPVFIKDVTEDPQFLELREAVGRVPFRSVLCCPLVTHAGELVGMVSAHSGHSFTPTALEMRSLDAYAVRLADAIAAMAPAEGRSEAAERLALALLQRLS